MHFILADTPSIVRCLVRAEFVQNHTTGHGAYLKAQQPRALRRLCFFQALRSVASV